ncbi:MAG: serine protease [Rhodospirillales bacterium]|nr:serine protease [Rhodospirillales bacterium]
MKELLPMTAGAFYNRPRAGGASTFAEGIRNLAIPDVAATGHRFRLIGGDPTAVRIEQQLGDGRVPEKINFAVDYLPAVFLALGAERSRAVALIETEGFDHEGKQQRWSGTGFLVHANLLLTNYHVLNSIAVAKSARIIFNFQLDPNQKPAETVAFKLDPDRLFLTSPLDGGLDYTFVWIDDAASRQFGIIAPKRSAFTILVGDRANIIQHPRGRRKEIVLQNNEVIQDTGLLLHYASDTDIGSSGSPVFDNRWQVIALHHAALPNRDGLRIDDLRPPPAYLNEGIKMSTIAADLERRVAAGVEGEAPGLALAAFSGINSLMGYFGGLGRPAEPQGSGGGAAENAGVESAAGVDRVVDIYSGENRDLDIAFWNVDWFSSRTDDKVERLAAMIADINLDIWVLAEATAAAGRALCERIRADFGLDFGLITAAGPDVATDQRTTAVIWNTATVSGQRVDWPADVADWFRVDSQQFDALRSSTVPGPVFDDTPGVFSFSVGNRVSAGFAPFDIRLISLQSKASGRGQQRRRMAARIVAAAIAMLKDDGHGSDWILGGDFDAAAATAAFGDRFGGTMAALAAAGEPQGAVGYLRSSGSLTYRILLSPNLTRTFGADDLLVTAGGQPLPEYLERFAAVPPLFVRLCLADHRPAPPAPPPSLLAALGEGEDGGGGAAAVSS